MTTDIFKRAILFIILVLAQVIVLGRLHLFNCATPLLYVWFVILFPRNYPKWASLLWSFFMGLTIDTFSNTPGLAAASMTLVAVVQPYLFEVFVPRDSIENLEPSMQTIGPVKYLYYASALVLLYCVAFYALEFFNFFNIMQWLMCVVGSTLLTLLLIFTFETVRSK